MQTRTFHAAESPAGDFPYFRRLWNTIVAALIGAAFIPLLVIGGVMYHLAAPALQQKIQQSLVMEVRYHQRAVDRFLAERIGDLRQIADTTDLYSLTEPGAIEAALASLHSPPHTVAHTDEPYFTDLGVIDEQGRHLAYAGPYDLIRENYARTEWFGAVMARDVYVSDVFYGFRNIPHFIIAVRQSAEARNLILRATVNAAFFDNLVNEITANGSGSAFLINSQGLLQTSPAGTAQWMQPSGIPAPERFEDVVLSEHNGRIRVMGWLETVPWISVVQVDRQELFKLLQQLRYAGIVVFILGAILIVFTALLTTNHLVNRLEVKRRSIRLMGGHLRQANKLTLSLLLYRGFFQEITESLANIGSASAWMDEQIQQFAVSEEVSRELNETLGQIRAEISRSRTTIQQLIGFSQPRDPLISSVDINQMLENVIALFQREVHFKNIRIVKNFQEGLPILRIDPSLLDQVLQNLMFNAMDAIQQNGQITLQTRSDDETVYLTIADDGPGMTPDILEKIFTPPFTTRPGRLGLGLAICRDILNKNGGTIRVSSQPDQGAAFTLSLPVQKQP